MPVLLAGDGAQLLVLEEAMETASWCHEKSQNLGSGFLMWNPSSAIFPLCGPGQVTQTLRAPMSSSPKWGPESLSHPPLLVTIK